VRNRNPTTCDFSQKAEIFARKNQVPEFLYVRKIQTP